MDGMLPPYIADNYEVLEYRHGLIILANAFAAEWQDVVHVLTGLELRRSHIEQLGGNQGPISRWLQEAFRDRGWEEQSFDVAHTVNAETISSQTHKVDCFRNRIALEVEWNSKDSVFVRDLAAFRLLYDLGCISVGVVVTRCTELQEIFNSLGQDIARKFGQSTTHMGKLRPRLDAGAAGGCPVVVFGIRPALYRPDL
jgi:hypothetical protein